MKITKTYKYVEDYDEPFLALKIKFDEDTIDTVIEALQAERRGCKNLIFGKGEVHLSPAE